MVNRRQRMEREAALQRHSRLEAIQTEANSPPANASDYIPHLPDLIVNGIMPAIVTYFRVSTEKQERKGNLDDQINKAILTDLPKLGYSDITFLQIIAGCESGSIIADRPTLDLAIEKARELNAVLVAPSRTRIIRATDFSTGRTRQESKPSVFEYEELLRRLDGVKIATILHPDSTEERSNDIKRGQAEKGKGGRPKKKRGKYQSNYKADRKAFEKAWRLYARCFSFREIARKIGRSVSTVQYWIRKAQEG